MLAQLPEQLNSFWTHQDSSSNLLTYSSRPIAAKTGLYYYNFT